MSREQQAFLCVADITGYTGYLNESELEHAQGTLTDLLELLVDRAGPPMRVSKLEGDAVFSYAFEDSFIDGRTFLDLVEGTYVAFRRAIDPMVLNNTGRCNACANVSSLDLKFVIHFGSFIVQRTGSYDELLGPDVNLVHRILKNTVTDRLGLRAYCMYTRPAWERLGLDEVTTLVEHDEDVSDFGLMRTFIQDLGEVYNQVGSPEITLDDSQLLLTQEADIPQSPAVVWDYLSSPAFRNILIGAERVEIDKRVVGRVGVGSVYQCYHGQPLDAPEDPSVGAIHKGGHRGRVSQTHEGKRARRHPTRGDSNRHSPDATVGRVGGPALDACPLSSRHDPHQTNGVSEPRQLRGSDNNRSPAKGQPIAVTPKARHAFRSETDFMR
jgi:hypothetical protein